MSDLDRLLVDNGFVLARHKKHNVWRRADGVQIVASKKIMRQIRQADAGKKLT